MEEGEKDMEQFTIEELRAIRNLAGDKALGMKRLKDDRRTESLEKSIQRSKRKGTERNI